MKFKELVKIITTLPLAMAAYDGDAERVEKAMKKWYTEVNPDAIPALHMAAQRGHANVVEVLLRHPYTNINHREKYWGGCTALNMAVKGGHPDVVHVLLRRSDIDATLVNGCGKSPLEFSIEFGNLEVMRLLLRRCDIGRDLVQSGVDASATEQGQSSGNITTVLDSMAGIQAAQIFLRRSLFEVERWKQARVNGGNAQHEFEDDAGWLVVDKQNQNQNTNAIIQKRKPNPMPTGEAFLNGGIRGRRGVWVARRGRNFVGWGEGRRV